MVSSWTARYIVEIIYNLYTEGELENIVFTFRSIAMSVLMSLFYIHRENHSMVYTGSAKHFSLCSEETPQSAQCRNPLEP